MDESDTKALSAYLIEGKEPDAETSARLHERLTPQDKLSSFLRNALTQELNERTESEMDPAEAMREAVRFTCEVKQFIEGQGMRIASRIEADQDKDVHGVAASDGSGDILPVAVLKQRPK